MRAPHLSIIRNASRLFHHLINQTSRAQESKNMHFSPMHSPAIQCCTERQSRAGCRLHHFPPANTSQQPTIKHQSTSIHPCTACSHPPSPHRHMCHRPTLPPLPSPTQRICTSGGACPKIISQLRSSKFGFMVRGRPKVSVKNLWVGSLLQWEKNDTLIGIRSRA